MKPRDRPGFTNLINIQQHHYDKEIMGGGAMGEEGGWCTLPCMSYVVSFRFFSMLCFLSINVLEYNCVII